MLMMSKMAVILDVLSDGKWHGIEELKQRMEMGVYEVQEIARFLNKYGFAMIDDANKKVKINRDFQRFLARTMI
jgi:hypothetical protein